MALNLKAITIRLGYQQITGLTEVKGLTVPAVDLSGFRIGPTVAVITVEGAGVRWRDDDVAPTAAVGMPIASGVTLQYDGDLSKIKFIEQSATAKINVSYYA